MDVVINLNKPKGITSQEAVSAAKKILKVKKAGHTGTLDPIATGVLLVCINRATKLASYFSSLDKEYVATMKLGEATDTQDLSGNIIERAERVAVTEEEIRDTLKSFEGRILQKPPMFSALKHRGTPLYKFARKGIDIRREPREIYIHRIKLLDVVLPFVVFRALCSKGTYIRTLCDDIGRKLGTCAHLFELERTAIGPFKIENAVTFDEIQNPPCPPLSRKPSGGGEGGFENYSQTKGVYNIDTALSWMPEITVRGPFVKNVKNGNPVRIEDCLNLPVSLKTGDSIKIKSPEGEFLAVGHLIEDHRYTVKTDVVLA